ncbi:MAG: prepilin-type N-terminal cleavage/methylation domain-containing protein [Gaiellaceae bacterium]|jgi:prepilin-type N-terminal cleavage/methylation domain-containing protein
MHSPAVELQVPTKAGEEAGFTLIELLVVIVILGVLITIAVVSYLGFSDRASRTAAKANVRTVVPAMTAYYTENSTYIGATLTTLRNSYDLQIDDSAASHYKISDLSDGSYCLQDNVGDWYAWTTGPNAPIDTGSASHC